MTVYNFVVGDNSAPTPTEVGLRSRLVALGHTVNYVLATVAPTGTTPVIISETISSSALHSDYKLYSGPILCFEPGVAVALGLTSITPAGTTNSTWNFVAGAALNNARSGGTVFTSGGAIAMSHLSANAGVFTGRIGQGAVIDAYTGASGSTDTPLFHYAAAGKLADNADPTLATAAPNRRVACFIKDPRTADSTSAVNLFADDGVTVPRLSTVGLAVVDDAIAYISVGSSNAAPTANAGVDQTVITATVVTLAGAAADADGTIATHTWRQISGTSVTLSGTGANRTFTAPAASGTALVFGYKVTDNLGADSTEDTISVTVVTAGQYARPNADVSTGGWTPSTGTTLYDKIDDPSADATDYIQTPASPNGTQVVRVGLSTVQDPIDTTGAYVEAMLWRSTGSTAGSAHIVLIKGASTVVASWTQSGLTTTPTLYPLALDATAMAALAGNYNDLDITIDMTVT